MLFPTTTLVSLFALCFSAASIDHSSLRQGLLGLVIDQ